MIDWRDPRNWYWAVGSIGWVTFIAVCLRWLWLSRGPRMP